LEIAKSCVHAKTSLGIQAERHFWSRIFAAWTKAAAKRYDSTDVISHSLRARHPCKPFPISETRRFLPAKTFDLWERIKQDKAIEQAGIEGLEVNAVAALSVYLKPN
jgi:hypothetical protein